MAMPGYYQPFRADSGLPSGMMDSASAYAMAQPMMSEPSFAGQEMVSFEQEAPEVAERLPAETLHKMYLAWEQAKTTEIHEQWLASRYYHCKQWTDAEIKVLKRRKQPITTENRIKRKVDFLVGVEQRLRRDPKAFPRNPMAEKAAPVATAAVRFVGDVNKWPSLASECCNDGMVRGIGALWQGAKVTNGKADVTEHQVKADRFFYDPRAEEWDFSDASYMGEHQWFDINKAKRMLPFASDQIDTLAAAGQAGTLSALPQEFDKARNWDQWIDPKQRRIRLISIWYEHDGNWMFDYLVGPISLCPEGHDCKSPYRGDDWSEENPSTDHPYNPWSPYVDETGDRYGVIRDMMSIQDAINKRSSKLLYQLSVRQTMGAKGAVDDIGKMKEEMAKPDGHVEYNEMGGTTPSFQIVDQSQQIQGQFELLQEHKAAIENLGPNPGLIGRGVEQQSGRAILAQQNSGMTELSPVFERMREWKLKAYEKRWRLIQQFWNGERYIRVTGDPRAVEFLSINKIHEDPMTGQVQVENSVAEMDVDIIMDEGPDTVTIREELMDQLAQLGPGAVPPELFIEMSNVGDKETYLKRLQEFRAQSGPPPEVLELQQRMLQLEALLKASQVDKSIADTDAVRATTLKTWVESGVQPKVQSMVFPMQYREPGVMDNLLMSGAGGQPQPPSNPMLAGPDGPSGSPEMTEGPEAALGNPLMPDQREGAEPQLGAPGGLPLGPGVGPQG
jgi:hypothetical protein